MIKSIELVNWKTHKRTVMNFQKGVNVLIGVMGAGKSSVIDGISFGLFGTFPALSQRKVATENLISNRPNVEDNAEVKLKFTVGDDEYTVHRKISRKETTAAKLEKNGSYLQTQPARVNEEIESLIKTDYDTFSRAIYSEQNRMSYFLELAKGDRKKQIDQMLGLDNFAKAEENTTSLINSLKSFIEEDEQLLAQADTKETKAQLEKLSKEKQDIEKEQAEIKETSKARGLSRDALEKELARLKLKAEASKRLAKETAETSSRIDTLKRELKGIKDLSIDGTNIGSEHQKKAKELEEHDTKIKALRKKESELVRVLADSEASLKQSRKKSEERDKLLQSIKGKDSKSIEKGMRDKESLLQNSVKEFSILKGRREDAKKWARELAEHISKCPVCERDLSEEMRKALLDQKNSTVTNIDSSTAKLDESIKKLEKELSESRKEYESVTLAASKLAQYDGLEMLIAKSSEQSKEHAKKHADLLKEVDAASKEGERLGKEMNDLTLKLDSVKRGLKYETEIKELSESLESKEKELKSLDFDEKKLYALQEQITKETALLADINGKSESNNRHIKSLEVQIVDKTKAIANLNSMTARIEGRRSQISNMNKFKTALVETEAQLRNSLVTSINALMQNIWPELYPYADYSSIRLLAKKDDYALEACVDSNGTGREWVEIDSIASGGERSIACLTMRIALAMVIVPNLRWLILDEPTHNIDENGIGKLIEVLGNSLPKVVEQIFIITHDNALKNISSARIYQLNRNKDRNEHTSIIES